LYTHHIVLRDETQTNAAPMSSYHWSSICQKESCWAKTGSHNIGSFILFNEKASYNSPFLAVEMIQSFTLNCILLIASCGLCLGQTRQCNEKLGVVTADDIKALGLIYLEPIVNASAVETARDVIFRTAVYDVQVMKLCSSCLDIDRWYFETHSFLPAHYLTYCDSSIYGYGDQQSFLVFLPLDPETGEVLAGTKLRVFLSLHGSKPAFDSAPTEAWPIDLSAQVASVLAGSVPQSTLQAPKITQVVPSMLAAASGSIALLPDYIGYGESKLNRTIFWSTGYEQASIVSYFGLSEYLSKNTSCIGLDNAVTIQGMEDGAFGSVYAAQAFRRHYIKVLKVFSASGVFDLDAMLDDAIRKVDSGGTLDLRLKNLLDLATFTFSAGTPGITNTGSGQDLVNEAYRAKHMEQFSFTANSIVSEKQSIINNTTPIGELDMINAELLAFYREAQKQGIQAPCKSNLVSAQSTIGVLCQTIANASAWPVLLSDASQHYSWIHPMELCYSPDDEAVSADQVETPQLSTLVASHITVYDGPAGASDNVLKPIGSDHKAIADICFIAADLFYGLQGHMPELEEDRPSFRAPLNVNDTAACIDVIPADKLPVESGTDAGGETGSGTSSNIDAGADSSGSSGNNAPANPVPTGDSKPAASEPAAAPASTSSSANRLYDSLFWVVGLLLACSLKP
jgi:hypothetical protein